MDRCDHPTENTTNRKSGSRSASFGADNAGLVRFIRGQSDLPSWGHPLLKLLWNTPRKGGSFRACA
eukprot:4073577-Prymnesium_polylepis.1